MNKVKLIKNKIIFSYELINLNYLFKKAKI